MTPQIMKPCSPKYATKVIHIGKTVFCGSKDEYLSSVEARLFIKDGEENG